MVCRFTGTFVCVDKQQQHRRSRWAERRRARPREEMCAAGCRGGNAASEAAGFIGNEPPWGGRESEVVDLILAGPDTATMTKLNDFLAQGDTPGRRKQFVVGAFNKYLDLICTAVKKYDPNHLNIGIRFGGKP